MKNDKLRSLFEARNVAKNNPKLLGWANRHTRQKLLGDLNRHIRQVMNSEESADLLAERANLASIIKKQAIDGKLYLSIWSRDCDMCESTRRATIPAYVLAFEKYESEEYEYAEGPTSVSIISKDDYDAFRPAFRDRVLEARENGSNYLV